MSVRPAIRRATRADLPQITSFLRDHWNANHVFLRCPDLLAWQHADPDRSDGLTYIVAEQEPGGIVGLLGYIPFRRFDPAQDWSELALAIWKVRDDAAVPGLGLQLLKACQREMRPEMVCAIALSEMVLPIYRVLGYSVGRMDHAALFPLGVAGVAGPATGVPSHAGRALPEDPTLTLEPLSPDRWPAGLGPAAVDAAGGAGVPRKSWAYVVMRYLRHPHFTYELRVAHEGGRLRALLVWRRVASEAGTVLRIVDVIGDPAVLARCGAALRRELAAADCAYIDIVCWGIDRAVLAAGGFVGLDDHPGMVLPNHFAPFVRGNVRTVAAVRTDGALAGRPVRLFRGDSDQDRPSQDHELTGYDRGASRAQPARGNCAGTAIGAGSGRHG